MVLDFVEWIAREPRLYSEVIATWRTSCPRLTIWEDAVDSGYVARAVRRGLRGDHYGYGRRRKLLHNNDPRPADRMAARTCAVRWPRYGKIRGPSYPADQFAGMRTPAIDFAFMMR